jgi:hypothetical protein
MNHQLSLLINAERECDPMTDFCDPEIYQYHVVYVRLVCPVYEIIRLDIPVDDPMSMHVG